MDSYGPLLSFSCSQHMASFVSSALPPPFSPLNGLDVLITKWDTFCFISKMRTFHCLRVVSARRSNRSIHRKSVLNIHWKDWGWSWSSDTLATWWEELTHWKRPWCWERLKAGREGDGRRWNGWMASVNWRTWVWASSGSWWWTGKPGVLQFMGLQRVGHDRATELLLFTTWNSTKFHTT